MPRQTVVIVPGFLGTHIKASDGSRIWFSLRMMFRGLRQIQANSPGVVPGRLVDIIYKRLSSSLSQKHDVHVFPTDWRISIKSEGLRLAHFLEKLVEESDQPLTVVSHSQGGLITRASIAQSAIVAATLSNKKGSKHIQLGTPNNGTYIVPHVLLDNAWLEPWPIFDGTLHDNSLREIASRYQGLLDMMPTDPELDLFSEDVWKKLYASHGINASAPVAKDLEASRDFREWINTHHIDASYTHYIAGENPTSPYGFTTGDKMKFQITDFGDGVVDWERNLTGINSIWLDESKHHVFLPRSKKVIKGILELIDGGSPSRLTKFNKNFDDQTISER